MDRFILSSNLTAEDKRAGFVAELIDMQGDPDDGGPIAVAWFRSQQEAERGLRAYKLPARF